MIHYSVFAQPRPRPEWAVCVYELQATYNTKDRKAARCLFVHLTLNLKVSDFEVWILNCMTWFKGGKKDQKKTATDDFWHSCKSTTWLSTDVKLTHSRKFKSRLAHLPRRAHTDIVIDRNFWEAHGTQQFCARVLRRTTLGEDGFKEICLMLKNTEPHAQGSFFPVKYHYNYREWKIWGLAC